MLIYSTTHIIQSQSNSNCRFQQSSANLRFNCPPCRLHGLQMKLLEKGQENDLKVEWSDQDNINKFSKLSVRMDKLNQKHSELKQEYEYLQDLEQELDLLDEETLKYKVGDAFISQSIDQVELRLNKDMERIKKELESDDCKIQELQQEMARLKAILYGKFGSSINLEKD